ncbi:hypothetical protein [Vibrio europaeus]|uniref:hypothetical protein n=1 Tax=Vibrio europaeus TaxID=300876 RepID=UPI0039E126E4
MGGSTDDTITVLVSMPFNWQADEEQRLGYVATGSSQGSLVVEPAPKEFASRTVEERLMNSKESIEPLKELLWSRVDLPSYDLRLSSVVV